MRSATIKTKRRADVEACDPTLFNLGKPGRIKLGKRFRARHDVTLFEGDCMELLKSMPDAVAELVVTSPPYNLGKEYEKRLNLGLYVEQQSLVIKECIRILGARGNICWQVGNYVDRGAIVPLDTVLYSIFADAGLRMRNRIIWHFEHGLHCSRRFSGRYGAIVGLTDRENPNERWRWN